MSARHHATDAIQQCPADRDSIAQVPLPHGMPAAAWQPGALIRNRVKHLLCLCLFHLPRQQNRIEGNDQLAMAGGGVVPLIEGRRGPAGPVSNERACQ